MDTTSLRDHALFIKSYLDTAARTTDALGDYTVADFTAEACIRAQEDCERFLLEVPAGYLRERSPEQAGQDFWFIRSRSGSGFWMQSDAMLLVCELARAAGAIACCLTDTGELDFT